MSVGLIRQATTPSYTGFYIPLLSAVYLYNEGASGFQIGSYAFPPLHGLPFIVVLVILFVGAVVNHGIYRSIFGRGGPAQNPKDKWTVRYQRHAFLFWKHPQIRPSSLSEAENRLEQGIDYATSSWISLVLIISRFLSLWFIRTAYNFITLAVFALLGTTVISDSIDYLGFGLLIAQALFLFSSIIWKQFAPVTPEESAEWIFVPEHRRAPTLLDDEDIEFHRDPRGILNDLQEEIDYLEINMAENQSDKADNLANEK